MAFVTGVFSDFLSKKSAADAEAAQRGGYTQAPAPQGGNMGGLGSNQPPQGNPFQQEFNQPQDGQYYNPGDQNQNNPWNQQSLGGLGSMGGYAGSPQMQQPQQQQPMGNGFVPDWISSRYNQQPQQGGGQQLQTGIQAPSSFGYMGGNIFGRTQ